jgi:hypothetical protein
MAVTLSDANRFERLSRYLSGQLNDADAAQFEGDWARNPGWTAELELDARLQAGLGELRRKRQLETAMRGPWWAKSLRVLAMAASVAGIGIALWTWQLTGRAGGLQLTPAPTLMLGDSVAVMRLRAASPVSGILELPVEPRSIELRVMPDVAKAHTGDAYSMSLAATTVGATTVASTLEELAVGKDGFIRAYVDSRDLSAGRYRLTLRRGNSLDADEFLILVTAPATIPHAD